MLRLNVASTRAASRMFVGGTTDLSVSTQYRTLERPMSENRLVL